MRRVIALVRHVLVFELHIYLSLLRWAARRPSVPEGQVPVGYARLATPVIWLWIFGSALELPLVHVLVPWHGLRIALLAVGLWGLLWMIGMLAGLRCYPHLLGDHAIRVRNGPMHDIAVPWSAVSSVSVEDRDLPSTVWALQPLPEADGTRLNVGVSGRVNLHLGLTGATAVSTRKGTLEVTAVSLWVDDPREVAAEVRRRMHAADGHRTDRA